jgi:hypothetical protein
MQIHEDIKLSLKEILYTSFITTCHAIENNNIARKLLKIMSKT